VASGAERSEEGVPGQERHLHFELKLLADCAAECGKSAWISPAFGRPTNPSASNFNSKCSGAPGGHALLRILSAPDPRLGEVLITSPAAPALRNQNALSGWSNRRAVRRNPDR